jgi:hypothetical protein
VNERVRVLLALSPRDEQAVEHLLFDKEATFALVASALDAAELERVADGHGAEVVLVSPELPGLSPALCTQLRASGLRVVGLALDDSAAAVLGAFGVDAIVGPEPERDTLRAALGGEGSEAHPERRRANDHHRSEDDDNGGSILAVVGGRGAPGATECAVSLAALAQARWPTALVECDLLGGGLDLRLAADGHAGSLLGLVRACAAGDGAVGELLERWLVSRSGWPPVLLGPPDPKETLGELTRPGAIAGALRALAAAVPLVVCDVGFLLEEGGTATSVARSHREALASANAVILVIGARERQLRDGLAQLDLLRGELEIPDQRLRVACTGLGARGTGSTRMVIETLAEQLAERGLALDAALPFDGRALQRAERRGVPLAAARSRGAYARALRRLLSVLFLPTVTAKPRERKLLLPLPPRVEVRHEEVTLPWRTS